MKYGALMILGVAAIVIFVPMLVVLSIRGPSPQYTRNSGPKEEIITIRVYLHEENTIAEMELEEYVKGVVAAEMPAEFQMEALKAQAVAARTFAVKNMALFGGPGMPEKPGADITTDIRHSQGQAWLNQSKLKARWGLLAYQKYWNKISQAVDETKHMAAMYQGKPIQAVFHSTCGEKTASAKEVWGYDFPYLQSVPCPWDKESPRYLDSKQYTLAEIDNRLGTDTQTIAVTQGGGSLVQVLDRTESGRVDKVRIGGALLSGVKVRELLELRSNNFSVKQSESGLEFLTTGYGHGVGMCQYGANGMAKAGKSYKEILTHYYTGVTIEKISRH